VAPWYRRDPARGAIVIAVHVQPQARRTEVAGLHGDSLKIRLAAPPLDNRANEKRLEVRASSVDPEIALALPAARRGS
jgi:uncharacterized protein YggU (UPF0235/DUF167 family)